MVCLTSPKVASFTVEAVAASEVVRSKICWCHCSLTRISRRSKLVVKHPKKSLSRLSRLFCGLRGQEVTIWTMPLFLESQAVKNGWSNISKSQFQGFRGRQWPRRSRGHNSNHDIVSRISRQSKWVVKHPKKSTFRLSRSFCGLRGHDIKNRPIRIFF